MTNPRTDLFSHYATIESGFRVRANPNYRNLVVPNGNSDEPVHRWFHLKEAFSFGLLERILKDLGEQSREGFRVLDPFAGAGTTLVSAAALARDGTLQRATAYGIESNPFLQLVADTKFRTMTMPSVDALSLAQHVAAKALRSRAELEPPNLSTFRQTRYFRQDRLQHLLRLRQAHDDIVSSEGASLATDVIRVALGATVEAVAHLRRDGRALRYTPKPVSIHPIDIFLRRCEEMQADMPERSAPIRGRVVRGDAVTMKSIDRRYGEFDLIVFSPPYPNNIDYTEVYKLENWFLGLIDSPDGFRQQRLRTLHSHPSISRPGRLQSADLAPSERRVLHRLLAPILGAMPDDRYARGRTEMVEGYVVDMFSVLKAARSRIKPTGTLVYVVGNSAHGHGDEQFVIAADLLIAVAAQAAGFDIEQIDIAREPTRRSCKSPYLRESVVFARPAADHAEVLGS